MVAMRLTPTGGCIPGGGSPPIPRRTPFPVTSLRREAPLLGAGSSCTHNTITQLYSKSIDRYLLNAVNK